jgi:hypothetical protein
MSYRKLRKNKKADNRTQTSDPEQPSAADTAVFLTILAVNIGHFSLDSNVKIGYHNGMFRSVLFFVLRISLVAALWASVWKFIEPKTQLMRVVRAALLVLGLLVILAALKLTGQQS